MIDLHTSINGNIKCNARSRQLSQLGLYVYALRDPRDRKIFYVGKAGGRGKASAFTLEPLSEASEADGKDGVSFPNKSHYPSIATSSDPALIGNSRVLDHFDEARRALSDSKLPRSEKVQRIIEIWSSGHDVEWFIVRHGLRDANEAHHIEGALIDTLEISQNGPTLNIQGGHASSQHGILSREDLDLWGSRAVSPATKIRRVFIFNISRALDAGISIYNATRGSWKIGQTFRKNCIGDLAVGLTRGISRGVFEIHNWVPSSTTGRWDFDGVAASGQTQSSLLHKDFSKIIRMAGGYFTYGGILIVEFDGQGHVRFISGSKNKKWQKL